MLSLESIKPDRWLSVWISLKFIEDCEQNLLANKNYIYLATKRKLVESWLNHPDETAVFECKQALFAPSSGVSAVISCALQIACNCYSRSSLLFAAVNAAFILKLNPNSYIEKIITDNLTFIVDYKIKKSDIFGCIEDVFNAASDADKEKLLFHLNQPEIK